MFWFGKKKITIVKDVCIVLRYRLIRLLLINTKLTMKINYTLMSTVNGKTNHFKRDTRPIAC